ncbi:putative oxidoreductase [Thalassocella blandensis]|nr:putative oxidoreductase [Thalassocella blandensis]
MQIENKVVVVTGGLSGLGEAVVQRLKRQGAKVAVFDLAESVEQENFDEYCRVNVTDAGEVKKAIEQVFQRLGRIDILVNCAGIAPANKIIDRENRAMPLDEFNKVLQVNVMGTVNTCALAAEHMVLNRVDEQNPERGVIINTASIAAYDGQKGQCAYAASKGAIASLTLPLARDLASLHIRAMAIAPGIMATPMMQAMPQKVQDALEGNIPFPARMGQADEFAALVQHIIENSYLNGEVVRLDGALRMA